MKRRAPKKPNIVVIPDSNILFTKSEYLMPKLIEDLFILRKKINVEIIFPDIVLREKFKHCRELIEDKLSGIEILRSFVNKLCNRNIIQKSDINAINSVLDKKLNSWLKRNNIQVIDTPCDKLRVSDIANLAVAKESVFREKKSDSFKDFLILKAIEAYLPNLKYKTKILFVSDDNILREEISRLFTDKNLSETRYEAINSTTLLEKLTVIANKLDQELTTKVLANAALVFFDKENKKGLWYESIGPKIVGQLRKILDDPNEGVSDSLSLWSFDATKWEPVDDGAFRINGPRLMSVNDNVYEFKTEVTYSRKFRKVKPVPSVSSLSFGSGMITMGESLKSGEPSVEAPSTSEDVFHTMEISLGVRWTARKKTGIALSNASLVEIEVLAKNSPPSPWLETRSYKKIS